MDTRTRVKFVEKPFFFQNTENQYTLFGVEYIPDPPEKACFLLLQPLGTERNVIDAVQVNLARALASAGVRCLRFDYFGTGDSEGSFDQITLDTLLSDIRTSFSRLVSTGSASRTGLFGLRFGALLGARFAEMNHQTIHDLILCSPVVDAFAYIKQELRQSISTQMVLFQKALMNRNEIIQNLLDKKSTVVEGYDLANLNGFPLTHDFLVSFKDVSLLKEPKKFRNNCLIIHIDKAEKKKIRYVENLLEVYAGAESVQWRQIVEKTIPWIHGNYFSKIIEPLNDTVINWIDGVNGVENGRNHSIQQ